MSSENHHSWSLRPDSAWKSMMPRLSKQKKVDNRAELILTTSFVCTGSGFSEEVVPAIHILGNPNGLRWLAKFIRQLADLETKHLDGDGDHFHLRDARPPCNSRLSDEYDIIFRRFTGKSRAQLLKQQGMSRAIKKNGNPLRQFALLLDELHPFILESWASDKSNKEWLEDCTTLTKKLQNLTRDLKKLIKADSSVPRDRRRNRSV